jgi:predicted PurR-regulated permease PerM
MGSIDGVSISRSSNRRRIGLGTGRHFFLATGAMWQGVVLLVYGAFVIGLADNVLRPILVGKDTKMPNYVVLISTLGGIEMFGFNGFVVGPVIAAMFIAAWDIYSASRQGTPDESVGG